MGSAIAQQSVPRVPAGGLEAELPARRWAAGCLEKPLLGNPASARSLALLTDPPWWRLSIHILPILRSTLFRSDLRSTNRTIKHFGRQDSSLLRNLYIHLAFFARRIFP